jgi:hypothetical protein
VNDEKIKHDEVRYLSSNMQARRAMRLPTFFGSDAKLRFPEILQSLLQELHC